MTDLTQGTLLSYLRRHRRRAEAQDEGTWLGMSYISQPWGVESRDHVRGLLIKMVASGEIEVEVFTNGVFWRVASAHPC